MRVYAVVESVTGLERGLYLHRPQGHSLVPVFSGPAKARAMTVVSQPWILSAPVVLLITGRYGDTVTRVGERGRFSVNAEAGHISQNIYLQATALGLGTVAAGGIDGEKLKEAFSLPADETPLYAMPLGSPK
jgi:SagB-type dehydrogenase family enzyme